jgi:hypothetical protein
LALVRQKIHLHTHTFFFLVCDKLSLSFSSSLPLFLSHTHSLSLILSSVRISQPIRHFLDGERNNNIYDNLISSSEAPLIIRSRCCCCCSNSRGIVMSSSLFAVVCRCDMYQTYQRNNCQPSGTRDQFHQPIGAKPRCTGTRSLVQSVSPTKHQSTLPVHTTRGYAQLLHVMLYAGCK